MDILDEVSSRVGAGLGLNASAPHKDYISRFVVQATFLGLPISGGVHKEMLPRLREVEKRLGFKSGSPGADQHGVGTISGYQSPGFRSLHSWGLAVDINYATNPYIMHEAGEEKLDKQLGPVYHRIARLMLRRDSVIPKGITGSGGPKGFYSQLVEESDAMQKYFKLMQDLPALEKFVQTTDGAAGLKLAFSASSTSAADVQRQMMNDWSLLTTSKGPAIPAGPNATEVCPSAGACTQKPYPKATSASGDRPFAGAKNAAPPAGRSPVNGFIDLRPELVTALTDANLLGGPGLRWGATDFGGQSGDVMHFDMGNQGVGSKVFITIQKVKAEIREAEAKEKAAKAAGQKP